MSQLESSASFFEKTNTNTSSILEDYFEQAMEYIEILEIENLNSLQEMSSVVQEEFHTVTIELRDILNPILNF